jgi:hypothetical protein
VDVRAALEHGIRQAVGHLGELAFKLRFAPTQFKTKVEWIIFPNNSDASPE